MPVNVHGQRSIKAGGELLGDRKIYVGDYGFFLDIIFDFTVTDATSMTFDIEKPGGTNVTFSTILIPDANTLRYVVEDGDMNEAGKYRVLPKFTLLTPEGATVVGASNIATFTVQPKITV